MIVLLHGNHDKYPNVTPVQHFVGVLTTYTNLVGLKDLSVFPIKYFTKKKMKFSNVQFFREISGIDIRTISSSFCS